MQKAVALFFIILFILLLLPYLDLSDREPEPQPRLSRPEIADEEPARENKFSDIEDLLK